MGKQNHQQQRMLPEIKLCTRFGKASDKVGYLEELPKHFCLQHTAWGGDQMSLFSCLVKTLEMLRRSKLTAPQMKEALTSAYIASIFN